jgi:GTP-binding protein
MAFIDEVQLKLKAGKGGDGVVRWRQEKYKPMAGPSGGNGGKGGNLYAETIDDLAYLSYYRYKKDFNAEDGQAGGNNSREGKDGEDIILRFPRGTVLTNKETGESYELTKNSERILILKGGRGGLGNEHFKASTNTTPYEWTPGTLGEQADFSVELKLFADAGFVGLPSVGKSTLLNALTNARSKVGAYHFTTLEPHLGALDSYILADIPGLINGASQGKGLGHKFLRHLARTKLLVHLVALDHEDPLAAYREIRGELEQYGSGLAEKQEIILLTKQDMVDEQRVQEVTDEFVKHIAKPIYVMSAYDDSSISDFKKVLINYLEKNN